jgi:hypothetical protein
MIKKLKWQPLVLDRHPAISLLLYSRLEVCVCWNELKSVLSPKTTNQSVAIGCTEPSPGCWARAAAANYNNYYKIFVSLGVKSE